MKYRTEEEKEAAFTQLASTVRRKAAGEVRRHERLLRNLDSDLEKHGDPEVWKRYGDLLLASPHAERRNDKIVVTDYFAEGSPAIEIDGDRDLSINEIGQDYYRRYTKARNARDVVHERKAAVADKLRDARDKLSLIDAAIEKKDEEFLRSLVQPTPKPIAVAQKRKKDAGEFKGARRFLSSDGFEILVGKKAADNDLLTFRVARSMDIWMHAADYPGSHVVIRNAGKKKVPDNTLVEAASLAAFYSDARGLAKAAVRHTLKKFVNKPKRAAAGMVSLSSFKTMMVMPEVPARVTQI